MTKFLDGTYLRHAGVYEKTNIYELEASRFKNRYFVVTGPGSRHLLSSPEVIGFPCYSALLDETVAALRHLFPSGPSGDIDILTILRGGLNYPLEEACSRLGIRVRDIHFVSCERVIENHVITGLDIRYEKVTPGPGRILAIGDILATGDTFRMCMDQVAELFKEAKGSIKRIIMFTIGGTRAISLMEDMRLRFSGMFPGFEGFDCIFYEGIFTVYESTGVSGINVPNIDFGWKDGAVSPEFRAYSLDRPDSIFEKCIIYDGGARRYEIPLHFQEVLEYWEGIRDRASSIDPVALLKEKLGYDGPVPFEEWKSILHLEKLADSELAGIWSREQALFEGNTDLAALSRRRIAGINSIKKLYETH